MTGLESDELELETENCCNFLCYCILMSISIPHVFVSHLLEEHRRRSQSRVSAEGDFGSRGEPLKEEAVKGPDE